MTEPRQDTVEKVARAIRDKLYEQESRNSSLRLRTIFSVISPTVDGYVPPKYAELARAAINAMSDVREALKLRDVLENVGEVYGVAGIRMTPSLPYNWYVVGPEGEVAYCQTENGEQHAKMIAAALNDRVAMCALKPALNSLSGGGK